MNEKVLIDNIQENGCVSVLKYQYLSYEGKEIEIPNTRWRAALTPLDEERAIEILPPNLLSLVLSMWTEEVKQAYLDSLPA